jgi:hypothetical protein
LNYHRGRYFPCYTIHFLTICILAHGSILSILSSQGSITIHCTRMRAGVELCHSPPRRFSQPVVHNQESPLVSYASYVCVRVAGLYSTRGILKLDSRSQGKRRRTEEKAHSHQNRVSYSIMRWVYIQSLPDCHGWMWVFSGSDFSRVSLKRLLSVTLRCLRR